MQCMLRNQVIPASAATRHSSARQPDSQIPAPATLVKGNQVRFIQAPVKERPFLLLATETYTALACHNTSNV